jgi:hypothetical protein
VQTGALVLPAATALPCTPFWYCSLMPTWQLPHVAGIFVRNVELFGSVCVRILCDPWQLVQFAATSSPSLPIAKP